MTTAESITIPTRGVVKKTLDERLIRSALTLHELAKAPLFDKEGNIQTATLRVQDDALLRLILLADARGHAESRNAPEINGQLWVPQAIRGIRRATKVNPNMGGMERARLYSSDPNRAQVQLDAYEDMHERSITIAEIGAPTWEGLEYATRVALGQIAIDQESSRPAR